MPQFPQLLKSEKNVAYFIGFYEEDKQIHVKCLEYFLAENKCQ
jgi:hypothetical protein